MFENRSPKVYVMHESCSVKYGIHREGCSTKVSALHEGYFINKWDLFENRSAEIYVLREDGLTKRTGCFEYPSVKTGAWEDKSFEMRLTVPSLFQNPFKLQPEGIEELS